MNRSDTISSPDDAWADPAWAVDSATRPCCQGIGDHTQECPAQAQQVLARVTAECQRETVVAEKTRMITQLRAALDFMPDDRAGCEQLRGWIIWQLRNFLDTVSPDDLGPAEAMALVAALGPVFSRTVAAVSGPTEGAVL